LTSGTENIQDIDGRTPDACHEQSDQFVDPARTDRIPGSKMPIPLRRRRTAISITVAAMPGRVGAPALWCQRTLDSATAPCIDIIVMFHNVSLGIQ
jgi:hypothetical protein